MHYRTFPRSSKADIAGCFDARMHVPVNFLAHEELRAQESLPLHAATEVLIFASSKDIPVLSV